MSRIGKIPVKLPPKVKISQLGGKLDVEGPKGKLALELPPLVSVKADSDQIVISADEDSRQGKMMHGLARSLIAGMVKGVTDGYKKELEIVGVGYKAQLAGSKLTIALGYSHPVVYNVPQGIKVTVADSTKITIEGIDKQLVGQAAATIRRFKKPDPYKGKGVRFVGETIKIKEGKTVA